MQRWGLHYAPKAAVLHRHRNTTWSFVKQQWSSGRGHALLYIKYRREIPWGWSQTARAYKALGAAAFTLAKTGIIAGMTESNEDVYFYYYEFLKKLAERLGFIRQSLAKGYLYF